jgi:hypothetical protein
LSFAIAKFDDTIRDVLQDSADKVLTIDQEESDNEETDEKKLIDEDLCQSTLKINLHLFDSRDTKTHSASANSLLSIILAKATPPPEA